MPLSDRTSKLESSVLRRPGAEDLQGLRRYREDLSTAIACLEDLESFRRSRLEARRSARRHAKFSSAA
ncbi:MAG: hypothetical protein ACLQVN_22970 [Bryobacteraceae bacterium]